MEIAGRFVDRMMLSEDFTALASLHQFSRDELVYIIIIATESGLLEDIPSPCVNDVVPRLLGIVLLQKPRLHVRHHVRGKENGER